uniref:Uncharacterized protein n=1 Tax=Rhizophora mucronata TaxID=61149 RepID=A0A2P2NTJ2_RHIMU
MVVLIITISPVWFLLSIPYLVLKTYPCPFNYPTSFILVIQ